jgi:hypothetical protein
MTAFGPRLARKGAGISKNGFSKQIIEFPRTVDTETPAAFFAAVASTETIRLNA